MKYTYIGKYDFFDIENYFNFTNGWEKDKTSRKAVLTQKTTQGSVGFLYREAVV